MEDTYVRADVCESKCEVQLLLAERDRARLDKHSESIDKLTATSVQLAEMIHHHEESLCSHEKRICGIELRPGTRWESAVSVALSALISAAVAYILR